VTQCNCDAPWYHGSPHRLSVLSKGSWITHFKEIAKAFSHKPSLMSLADDCQTVKHNGALPGFLYTIAEKIGPADISELPDTAHTHFQTHRDLSVHLVAEIPVSQPPLLTAKEIADMRQTYPDATKGTRFIDAAKHRNDDTQKPADPGG